MPKQDPFVEWIKVHPDVSLAGGIVVVLLIAGWILSRQNKTPGVTTASDISGLENGLVYVPTQTSFTTTTISGDTTTYPPGTAPNPPGRCLVWDQSYTATQDDTLSTIAASVTRSLRTAGMPTSQSIGWHDIYARNVEVVNSVAQQHGDTADFWNHIYSGETLTVPRWKCPTPVTPPVDIHPKPPCPKGMHVGATSGLCKCNAPNMHYDPAQKKCVPNVAQAGGGPDAPMVRTGPPKWAPAWGYRDTSPPTANNIDQGPPKWAPAWGYRRH
jgi:hypothetical protein